MRRYLEKLWVTFVSSAVDESARAGKAPELAAPYTSDPYVAVANHVRLQACVARWRALAECYSQPEVRDTLILCADELEKTLTQRPTIA